MSAFTSSDCLSVLLQLPLTPACSKACLRLTVITPCHVIAVVTLGCDGLPEEWGS